MPSISDLVIVLPCEGLDDFPTHVRDREATSLLTCWTGLWHPALLNEAGQLPRIQSTHASETVWRDFDSNANTQPSPLLVVPAIGSEPLDSKVLMTWSTSCDPILVEQPVNRAGIFSAAASVSKGIEAAGTKISHASVLDFYALGYAYLQVQLMTRKLRYSSNLNEPDFLSAVKAAAKAAVDADEGLVHEKLFSCFDLLLEEKNCYYPVEPQLCEILLLHENTLGNSLDRELDDSQDPASILLTGQLAAKLADKNQLAVDEIKKRLADKSICLIGGLEYELANELVSSDTWVNQLKLGRETLDRIFGYSPNVFARRQFGLNPTSPNLLQKFGYEGVIHASFSDGRMPDMGNGIMRWDGDDGEAVLAVSERPMDAADSSTFLQLSMRLGEMIDSAHEATALLGHWPGKTCGAFQDLKRVSRFVPLLGSFVTLDELFEEAYDPGYGQSFSADEYRSPHLANALATGQTDPISRYTKYWRRRQEIETIRRLFLIAACSKALSQQSALMMQAKIVELQNQIDLSVDGAAAMESDSIDQALQALLQTAKDLIEPDSTEGDSSLAWIVNVQSAKNQVEFSLDPKRKISLGTVRDKSLVMFAANTNSNSTWVVDLPQFGQSAVDWNKVEPKDQFKKDPGLSDGFELQNEYFRVLIDSKSGGIKSVRKHLSRTNIVGQQLSIRLPAKHPSKQRYATMLADSVETIEGHALAAAIESKGRLVVGEQVLAKFSQTVRVVRGINRIEVAGTIELSEPLNASSQNHYVCSRLAWKSEAARLYSNILDSRMQVSHEWFHGTQYISIRDETSVTMLTGGLPYHRRPNRRMLDSLLMIGKESVGKYSFAIDVDQNYPAAAAAARLSPKIQIPLNSVSDQASKWFFHFNRKNVSVTFAVPLIDDDGSFIGAVFRLKETEARDTELTIRSFRRISLAEIIGFNGEHIGKLEISPEDQSKIQFRIEPLSYFEIRLHF